MTNTALEIAQQALRDILDPIGYMERSLEEGYRLDGHAALRQMNTREFYVRLAREALAASEAAAPAQQAEPVAWAEVHRLAAERDRLTVEVVALRGLAATCYAGLGGECDLPENWLDVLSAATNGEPFSTEGLLPYTASKPAAQGTGELPPLPPMSDLGDSGASNYGYSEDDMRAYARAALAQAPAAVPTPAGALRERAHAACGGVVATAAYTQGWRDAERAHGIGAPAATKEQP